MGPFHGGAEQQLETGLSRAELCGWEERQVDLERAAEYEHAVGGRAKGHVDVMQRAVIAVHHIGPIGESIAQPGRVGDAKCQIKVGPAVVCAECRRTGNRRSANARVCTGDRYQCLAQTLTLLDRVHDGPDSRCISTST